MEPTKLIKILKVTGGILFAIAYILFSSSIKSTEYIWIFTRVFGMVSIILLFAVVLIGEFRLLGYHRFFKFHHFLGITTFYVVMLHFVSAIFDKFKWGKTLGIVDYLGTNFSDKWMIALSVGALAFYLIVLIGVTSAYSVMRKIGYRKWKLTHFLSYLTLIFAFGHSIVLGTDFNHSGFKLVVFPAAIFIFTMLLGLLCLRILKVKFDTAKKMAAFLVLVFIISSSSAYGFTRLKQSIEEAAVIPTSLVPSTVPATPTIPDVSTPTPIVVTPKPVPRPVPKPTPVVVDPAPVVSPVVPEPIPTPVVVDPTPVPTPVVIPPRNTRAS